MAEGWPYTPEDESEYYSRRERERQAQEDRADSDREAMFDEGELND